LILLELWRDWRQSIERQGFTAKILGYKDLAKEFWIESLLVLAKLTTRLVVLENTDTSILTSGRETVGPRAEENSLSEEWFR
jgi:hypothetical protein